MSAIPGDAQERNFIDNFCSKKLSSKELLQFNPEKINRSARAVLGLRSRLTQDDLQLLHKNIVDLGGRAALTDKQKAIYQKNLATLRRLMEPNSELAIYDPKDKVEFQWINAGWREEDRENFRNEITPLSIHLDKTNNPFHPSSYKGEEGQKELRKLLEADLPRHHCILIRKDENDIPGERFPLEDPDVTFSQEELSGSEAGKQLAGEFFHKMESLEIFEDEETALAVTMSITQNFLNPVAGFSMNFFLPVLEKTFPIYSDANGNLTREGVAGRELRTVIYPAQLVKHEQTPVILDLETKTASASPVLVYRATDYDEPILMYVQVDMKMDLKSGDMTISRMRPLAIHNFKTGEIEALERPDIPFRSNDWPFPPSS